jgi:hypothetical protein
MYITWAIIYKAIFFVNICSSSYSLSNVTLYIVKYIKYYFDIVLYKGK